MGIVNTRSTRITLPSVMSKVAALFIPVFLQISNGILISTYDFILNIGGQPVTIIS